jgi:hypothetical protein
MNDCRFKTCAQYIGEIGVKLMVFSQLRMKRVSASPQLHNSFGYCDFRFKTYAQYIGEIGVKLVLVSQF